MTKRSIAPGVRKQVTKGKGILSGKMGGPYLIFRRTRGLDLLIPDMIGGWDLEVPGIEYDTVNGDDIVTTLPDYKDVFTMSQSETSKKPVIDWSDPDFNGWPSMEFDGSDDVLKHTLADAGIDTLKDKQKGEVFVVATVRETPDESKIFLGASRESVDNENMQFDGWEGSRNDSAGIAYNDGDNTTDLVYGDSAMQQKKANVINYRSDTEKWSIELNNVDQSLTISKGNNVGSWFGDRIGDGVENLDNLTLGALIRKNSLYRKSKIAAVYMYDPLSSSDRNKLTEDLMKKYGAG